jgi:hypothetical protein
MLATTMSPESMVAAQDRLDEQQVACAYAFLLQVITPGRDQEDTVRVDQFAIELEMCAGRSGASGES